METQRSNQVWNEKKSFCSSSFIGKNKKVARGKETKSDSHSSGERNGSSLNRENGVVGELASYVHYLDRGMEVRINMPLGIAIHNIEITCGRGGPNAAYNSLLYCALQVCFVPLLPLTMASPWEITLMGRKKKGLRDPPGPTLDTLRSFFKPVLLAPRMKIK